MRRLSALLSATLLLSAWSSTLRAQEAVSNTSTSGPSTSAASASTTTTDLSTGTTAPSAAVTNSSGAASAAGPSGAGIFSPTPVKIYATITGGHHHNVPTPPNKKPGTGVHSRHN